MRSHRRTTGRLATALCAAFMLVVPSSASAATIANGGFEAGAFTGWTKSTQGSGDWYVTPGPRCLRPVRRGPATGDEGGRDRPVGPRFARALPGRRAGGVGEAHADLQALLPEQRLAREPEHARAHGLGQPAVPRRRHGSGGAHSLRLRRRRAGHRLQDEPGDPTTLAPTTITLDLTPFAGQTVRLRFAEVDNQSNFTASVDDVAIDTVLIDSAAPETTITAGPADGETTSTSTPAFEFASGESGSSFACSVDGGAASACTSPFTATTLDDGAHTFSVAPPTGPAARIRRRPLELHREHPARGRGRRNARSRGCATRELRLPAEVHDPASPSERALVSAVVKVRGKRVTARRSKGRMTAAIDLRGLARGTYAVTVDARDARQRHFKETRRFRTLLSAGRAARCANAPARRSVRVLVLSPGAGPSASGFGVRSSRNEWYGATNGSGAITRCGTRSRSHARRR